MKLDDIIIITDPARSLVQDNAKLYNNELLIATITCGNLDDAVWGEGENMNKYKEDPTEVDLFNLHIEFRDQAKLKREALDADAEIKDELTRKKAYIKYRAGQVALSYHTGQKTLMDGEDKPIKKPTGPAIKSAVEADEELYKLEEEANGLQKKLDISTNYSSAISDKKYAIQGEISLWLGQYYADPVDVSRKGGDYVREITEIKEKMEASEERTEIKKRRKRRSETDE